MRAHNQMTKLSRPSFLLAAFAVALAGCATPEAHDNATSTRHSAGPTEAHAAVHWGYEGEDGPGNWGALNPDWELCKSGTSQSPIDLTNAVLVEGGLAERKLGEEVLNDEEKAQVLELVDNGHTIQVTTNVPITIDVGDDRYELVQFHFHAPSEHTIDGRHFPLEVHFVHKSESGQLAVIGRLFEVGEHNALIQTIIDALPAEGETQRHIEGLEFDLSSIRPLPQRYYRYEGSLTTPPCSEGVHWIVVADTGQVSAEQLEALDSRMPDNNRPIQPLNDRELSLVTRLANR